MSKPQFSVLVSCTENDQGYLSIKSALISEDTIEIGGEFDLSDKERVEQMIIVLSFGLSSVIRMSEGKGIMNPGEAQKMAIDKLNELFLRTDVELTT